MRTQYVILWLTVWGWTMGPTAAAWQLDESPAQAGEWGYRPTNGQTVSTNPPSFSWRLQTNITWELACATAVDFNEPIYQVSNLTFNVHCPDRSFPIGPFFWRYRARNRQGQASEWSQVRRFTIAPDTVEMPMPTQKDLLSRIPQAHPRLFLRPDTLEKYRQAAKGTLKTQYQSLVSSCERLLRNPASVKEPPTYPNDMERKSEAWRKMWWGNRGRVQKALGSASTLGFTWLIGGDNRYGQEAKRILLACARWNPKGSTGYRYNDEAGMPYNYYFARTYTFINPLLTEEEKTLCRYVMKVRGDEMYQHLCPGHLWRPYGSHANRAWHFLGEIALAFHGEIEDTDDWLWFAMNVFYNTYPVWSDKDGGWHEGMNYWNSYQQRFTWWADIMREVLGINAYDKPYYSKIGYYPMYLTPPPKNGAGFGDLNASYTANKCRELMTVLASQAQNPHWQWYVEQLGGPVETAGYIGFIRGALPPVTPVVPHDLPTSYLFQGTGQAVLNSQITDAQDAVQIVFKSSPFGTQSHGYEANNSFLLWGYGERLLIRSGYRDIYGSDHHRLWMWSTRSVNNITVNGRGQKPHSPQAQGAITDYIRSQNLDVVVGEAGAAYEEPLDRFTRAMLFVKPDLLIVYDRLRATKLSTFQYHLHTLNQMENRRSNQVLIRQGESLCQVTFHAPETLTFTQTNQYDPNPRPRIALREWHMTASTLDPSQDMSFVTLYRIHHRHIPMTLHSSLEERPGGYILTASAQEGEVTVLLPKDEGASLQTGDLSTTGKIQIQLKSTQGSLQKWTVDGIRIHDP